MVPDAKPSLISVVERAWPRTPENEKAHAWVFGRVEAESKGLHGTALASLTERDHALQLVCGFQDVEDFV
jgi:hypothetical protein